MLKTREDSFWGRMRLGLFCSVEVVITASQNLRDIANLRENGTLISVRTLRAGILIINRIYISKSTL